jgi:CMP-N-acetylneuraminic acid synthetase
MTKIVALVPIRHHSQRVLGKNYRLLDGKPLFHHIITSLLSCPEIFQVVVDTNSPPVLEGLRESFPMVQILERPEHLTGDGVPMNEILAYDTSQVEADFYLQTHTTNPLLSTHTISSDIEKFVKAYPAYDSLFSVTTDADSLVGSVRPGAQPQPCYSAANTRSCRRSTKKTLACTSFLARPCCPGATAWGSVP